MLKSLYASIVTLFLSFAVVMGNAYAAVPAAVQTELDTAKVDVMTIGGTVFAIAVGIILFKWFKRSL
jgi:hypothetical protein